MYGQDRLERVAREIFDSSTADETEARFVVRNLELTRFNQNYIHQNLGRETIDITIRVVKGGRTGVTSVGVLDGDVVREATLKACEFASMQLPTEAPCHLAEPRELPRVENYFESTAEITPAERADAIGVIISAARARGLETAGTYSAEVGEHFVTNTLGVAAYDQHTTGFLRALVSHGELTGYADQMGRDVREFEPERVAREAIEKAVLFDEARALEPGRYDTVFEPYAVADLVRFLGYLSFGAKAKQEGRSFMAERMGEQVMDSKVTIWDDGTDPAGLAQPFDAEGVPKQKVMLIDHGVAAGVVYDLETAAREDRESTGHGTGLTRWNTGPMPENMFLAPGNKTREELIRSTQRGILVTRFHYTHAPEPMEVVATGTTRDGIYLIEDGELTCRLNNMRFTESLLRAFGRVEDLSKETRITRDWWSTFAPVLPAVKIRDFNFTGTTLF